MNRFQTVSYINTGFRANLMKSTQMANQFHRVSNDMVVPVLDLVETGTVPTTETQAPLVSPNGRQRVKRQSITLQNARAAREEAKRAKEQRRQESIVEHQQTPPPPLPVPVVQQPIPVAPPTPVLTAQTPIVAPTPSTPAAQQTTTTSGAREHEDISSGVVIIPDRYRSFQKDRPSAFAAANKPPSAPRLPPDVVQEQLTWWQMEFLDLQMLYSRPWFHFMMKVQGISQRPPKDFILLQVRDSVAERGSEVSTQTLDAFTGQLSRGNFAGESPFSGNADRANAYTTQQGGAGSGGGGGLFGGPSPAFPVFAAGGGGGAPIAGGGGGGGAAGPPGMDDDGPEDPPTPAEMARRINSTIFETVKQADLEQSGARSADGRPQFVQSGARHERLRRKIESLHDREWLNNKEGRSAELRKTLREAGSAAAAWITRLQASGVAVVNPNYFGAYDLVFAYARSLTAGRTFSNAPDTAFTRIRDMNRDAVSATVSTFMAAAVARMMGVNRNLAGIGLRQPQDRQALISELNYMLGQFVYRYGYDRDTDTFYDIGVRNDERTMPIRSRASQLAPELHRSNVINGAGVGGAYAYSAAYSSSAPITLDFLSRGICGGGGTPLNIQQDFFI
jgi:hypothetical protein